MEEKTNIKVFLKILNQKRLREITCENYIVENPIISNSIIEFWGLKRINMKYRTKERKFDENSYSKQKMREEELIFIKKTSLFQPLRYYFEEQRKLNDILYKGLDKYQNIGVDNTYYKESISGKFSNLKIPTNPFVMKKNNRHRLDLTTKSFQVNEAREVCIEEYLKSYELFIRLIIEQFDLKFIKYKYIDRIISKHESSYTRSKIKGEECFLLGKVYQYSTWNKRVQVFYHLESALLSNIEINKESKVLADNLYFLNILIDEMIDSYLDENFEVAEDINFS